MPAQNLVRGRGLLCRSIMKSQMASPPFTNIYAALAAVVNTKFPEIGELLLTRVVLQFRRAYKRNDKPICIAASKFLAHLVNQQARIVPGNMHIRDQHIAVMQDAVRQLHLRVSVRASFHAVRVILWLPAR